MILISLMLAAVFPAAGDALTIKTFRKQVVLDPGHGGQDSGIVSPGNITEKQITLRLAQITARLLSEQYRVLITRPADIYLPQAQRAAFANHHKADLLISIHLHTGKTARGYFYYFDTPRTPSGHQDAAWKTLARSQVTKSRQAARLFAKICNARNQAARISCQPIPAIPLEGLSMPCVLAEPFSLSHLPAAPSDRESFLQFHAKMLAQSISAYFQQIDRN